MKRVCTSILLLCFLCMMGNGCVQAPPPQNTPANSDAWWLPTNPAQTRLSCSNRNLTALDVSGYTNLTYLSCYFNRLTGLDVSANTKLTELWCFGNRLTNALDLSFNTGLTHVDATNNSLTEIIVWDTNNLPATFLYDAGVTIREP